MAHDGRPVFATFGWSVACPGRKLVQVRDDVRGIVDWTKSVWSSYFPPEQGYTIAVSSPAGPTNGVQLAVSRGNFRATVAVESFRDPCSRTPDARAIRMFGRAESGVLAEAERDGFEMVQRFRAAGMGLGVTIFGALCWLTVGVSNPWYLLGGMMMVVVLLLSTASIGEIAGAVGERLAEGTRARAVAEAAQDRQLQEDIRRWRSLVRQFSAQRHALVGGAQATPFRALPPSTTRETADATHPSLPRALPTSFSFSS